MFNWQSKAIATPASRSAPTRSAHPTREPHSPKSLLRTIAVVSLLVVGAIAQAAGYYRVTYSPTGLEEDFGPMGIYSTWDYADTSDGGRGGSAASADFYGPYLWAIGRPGWGRCSGTITATFTWVPSFTGEPRPKSVIVRRYASASWSGDSGSCSNGLGDDPVPYEEGFGAVSSGNHLEVVTDPPATFTRPCTPSAYASVGTTPPPGSMVMGAGCSVYYRAEVYSVFVSLSGPFDVPNVKCLVGKPIMGSVTVTPSHFGSGDSGVHSGSIGLSNYHWTIAGDTFKSYTHTDHLGKAYFLLPADLTVAHPSWYWKDGGSDDVTATCDATVDSQSAGTVTGKKTAQVKVPDYEFWRTSADPSSYYPWPTLSVPYPTVNGISSRNTATDLGIRFNGYVSNPAGYEASGYGQFDCVQLVKSLRSGGSGTVWPTGFVITTGGVEVLDTSFPYGGPPDDPDPWNADGTDHHTQDSPSSGGPSPLSVSDHFKMYFIFRPPGGEWTPLQYIGWDWVAAGSGFGDESNWTPHPPGAVTASAPADTRVHPEWSSNITDYVPGGSLYSTGGTGGTTGSTTGSTSMTTGSTSMTTGSTTGATTGSTTGSSAGSSAGASAGGIGGGGLGGGG